MPRYTEGYTIRPVFQGAKTLLFFGVAALEAFQTANWAKAAFWVAIGIVFLVADNLNKNNREKNS